MFGIGGFEFFLILLFGFLIFGPDKLPEIAKTIGMGVNKFKKAKDEMDDVQDVLNSYASNLYGNMKDTSTIQGKVARLYTTLVSTTCRAVSGAAVLLCAILTVLLGYPRHRGLFSLGVESLICGGIFAGLIGVMGSRTMGFLSDKMLGRTVDIGLKSYFWMGCIFAGAGVIFLLAGFIIKWKDQKRIDVNE